MPTNSIVDYLKSQGQDSSFAARTNLAKSKGITNYTGTAEENLRLLSTLRGQTSQDSGSLVNTLNQNQTVQTSPSLPTVQPENPTPTSQLERTLPQTTNRPGSISAMQDVLKNISRTVYSQAPTVSSLLEGYSNNGLNINNPALIGNVINSDTTSRAGAISDLYNTSLNKAKEDQIQREKLFQNIAPTIYQEIQDNPGVSTTEIIQKYAQQYGVDPLEISGNLISYKTDQDKQNLLNAKSTIDILQNTGNSGTVNVPGLGKIDIKPSLKGDYTTINAGGKLFVFDKNTSKITPTGISTDDLSSENILSAIKDLNNPEILQTYLKGQGVNFGVGSIKISNQQSLDAFKKSITNQESGNYKEVNKDSGALGAYQIMPFHLSKIGLTDTPADRQKYLNTPELQDKLFNIIITNLGNQFNGDAAKMAAAYYGGNGGAAKVGTPAGDAPQDKYPSINSYVNSVLGRISSSIGNASNSNAKEIAKNIFSGTSSLNVNSLPTSQRAEVDKELNALKQNALKSGDFLGIMRASAGGKDVSDTFITSFDKSLNVIQQIKDLQDTIANESTGPIWGIIRSKNPYDTKAQQIKAQLAAIVPNLARGVYGEVGVLTDNDIANYSKTLPNLTSTNDVRDAVLGLTIRSVQRSLENKLKTQANSGRDVSGFVETYTQIKQLADSLEKKTGVSSSSQGTIKVKEKSSGRTGVISANEFNPNLYEKI